MKHLLALFLLFCIVSCKTEPKDYVTLSGTITNANSDSLLIIAQDYSKTIKVADDGSFKDTLKLNTGIYSIFDGTESLPVFLENGFDISIKVNADDFYESINYSGSGAEHSNFLAKSKLLHEKLLDIDALSNLNMDEVDLKLYAIEQKLSEFYNANTEVDSSIINSLKNQLKPTMRSYERYLAQTITLKTALPTGGASPSFSNYENYKGGTTSLSDLKGKYTYIDVWATWCGPCKVEIPYLKKLEKDYHGKNIQFVSLSIDDGRGYRGSTKQESFTLAKQGWKKMIKEQDLGGIQLLAPSGWRSEFIQDYRIDGIPRFILIDPDGNIVNPDAPRPSSPQIRDIFKKLSI
jgi:thiol-disulfide isomerase/thioredoxin